MNLNRVRLYYISFNLYNFSTGMIGVFLNLFILATASLLSVIYFNIFFYAGLELLYFATVYTLDYLGPKDLYILGAAIRAFTIILILVAATFVSNIIIFGFLYGSSIGTYWLGNNILMSDISKDVDRKDFVLKTSVIGDAVNLIAPTIAGIMIEYSQFAGPLRFAYDFIAAAIILLFSAYTLAIVKLPKEQKTTKFRLTKLSIKHDNYGHFKAYYLLSSMFTIPFSIILPIYVFLVTNSYVIAGAYGSMILVLALFSNYLAKIEHKYWKNFLRIGIVASVISSIPLLLPNYFNSLASIFIFTIIYTIFSTPLGNQASSNFLEMIEESKINRIYFWIDREYFITAGRAIAFIAMLILLIYFKSAAMSGIIYTIYLIPFMTLYLLSCLKSSQKAPPAKIMGPVLYERIAEFQ